MNVIKYNQQQLLQYFIDCDSLLHIYNRIKEDLAQKNQIVCSVRVNDLDIFESNEEALAGYELKGVVSFEVEYCGDVDFFDEFVNSMRHFINDIIQACPFISSHIYKQDWKAFHRFFADFIESMEALANALHLYKANYDGDIELWKKSEIRLAAVTQQILEAYSDKDYVLLADLLEYEMIDCLTEWTVVLNGSLERNKKPQKSNGDISI